MFNKHFWLISLSIILGFITVACGAPSSGEIRVAGATLPLAPYTLRAHARDSTVAGIDHITFLVNTIELANVSTDSSQPLAYADFVWNPSESGEYRIQARAFNRSGALGDSEVASVCVGENCSPASAKPQPLPPPASNLPPGASNLPPITPGPTATWTPTRIPIPAELTPASPTAACSGIPSIAFFNTSDASITAGGSAVLSWGAVTSADSIVIDQGIGAVRAPGSRTITPSGTTIYTMTAQCSANRNATTRCVTVTVVGAPKPASPSALGCSGTPNIASFGASPSTIVLGNSSTLSWGAVTNADSVSIDQGIGGIAAPGSRSVSPSGTTIYTITARCGGFVTTKQTTVTVIPPTPALPPPPPPPVLDTTPPNISKIIPNSTSLSYTSSCGGYPNTFNVSAIVTDPSGVAFVQLYYRYVPNKGSASTWYNVTTSPGGGGNYSVTVNVGSQAYTPLSGNDGHIEYYISARDNAGNSGNSGTASVGIQYCPS